VCSCFQCPQLSRLVHFLLWELSMTFYIFYTLVSFVLVYIIFGFLCLPGQCIVLYFCWTVLILLMGIYVYVYMYMCIFSHTFYCCYKPLPLCWVLQFYGVFLPPTHTFSLSSSVFSFLFFIILIFLTYYIFLPLFLCLPFLLFLSPSS